MVQAVNKLRELTLQYLRMMGSQESSASSNKKKRRVTFPVYLAIKGEAVFFPIPPHITNHGSTLIFCVFAVQIWALVYCL